MKLPAGATKGLPDKAPRGRAFAVTRLTHVVGQTVKAVFASDRRHELLADAVREAEALDYRLSPAIVLLDKEVL